MPIAVVLSTGGLVEPRVRLLLALCSHGGAHHGGLTAASPFGRAVVDVLRRGRGRRRMGVPLKRVGAGEPRHGRRCLRRRQQRGHLQLDAPQLQRRLAHQQRLLGQLDLHGRPRPARVRGDQARDLGDGVVEGLLRLSVPPRYGVVLSNSVQRAAVVVSSLRRLRPACVYHHL